MGGFRFLCLVCSAVMVLSSLALQNVVPMDAVSQQMYDVSGPLGPFDLLWVPGNGAYSFEDGAYDPYLVILGGFAFDPLDHDEFQRTLPERGDDGLWLVQFASPEGWDLFKEGPLKGARILDIVSSNTAVISFPKGMKAQGIDEEHEVRALVPYHPLFKFDAELLQAIRDTGGVGAHTIAAGLYDDLDSERIDTIEDLSVDGRFTYIERSTICGSFETADLMRMASLEWISHISPVMEAYCDNDVASGIMDVTEVKATLSLDGNGQIVAVADTGFDTGSNTTLHRDVRGRVLAAYAYGRSGNWSDADIHVWDSSSSSWEFYGGHGTHVVGSVLGNGTSSSGKYQGMAPKAKLVMLSTMDSTGSLTFPSYERLFKDGYRNGARVHTNSWSSRLSYGNYTWRSWSIDDFAWRNRNMTILFSAGNQGSLGQYSISTQASSKNVIAVGASENYRPTLSSWADNSSQMASFSSQGYTYGDNRIKPDVVAPGTWILSTRSSLVTDFWNHYWGTNSTYSGVNSAYAYMGGTSMSTPLVAGMTALVRQYYCDKAAQKDPSAALIKATVINGARPLSGSWSSVPNRYEGWGRVNLSNSLCTEDSNAGRLRFIDNKTGLTTGSTHSRMYSVSSNSSDLVLTLVWTDYPGSNTSSTKLVNDIDLKVIGPDGTVYCGNDLTSPFNSAQDRTNNVERVLIKRPKTGIYTINVSGFSVSNGPQPYAVAMSGQFTDAVAAMRWQEAIVPSVNGIAHLELSDSNLTDRGFVHVKVNTTTDATGESINLTEVLQGTKGTGMFKGSVKVTESIPGIGEVKVSGDESLSARYDESYPKRTLTATTRVLEVPKIWNVTSDTGGLTMTYLDRVKVVVNGTKGLASHFSVVGLASREYLEAKDDGALPDLYANDGNYTAEFIVPNYVQANFTLRGSLKRDDLPEVQRDSAELIKINTNLPRRPMGLTVDEVPEGNALRLEWTGPGDPNLMSYAIFRANETSHGSGLPGDFGQVHMTPDNRTYYTDGNLTDGATYFYRLASFNVMGYYSEKTSPVPGIPRDTLAPTILINAPLNLSRVNKATLLNYTVDPDAEFLLIQGAMDSDIDGIADSPWEDLINDTSTGDPATWDTTTLPGGLIEGEVMTLRSITSDEAGNRNVTGPLLWLTVDNSPPGPITITSEQVAAVNVSVYHLTGRTEPYATVSVLRDGLVLSNETANGNSGQFSIYIPLMEGVNLLTVLSYDDLGNGPTVFPTVLYIVYDQYAPEASVGPFEALNSKPFVLDGSGSFDNGPESDLSGIINYTWTFYFTSSWEMEPSGNIKEMYGPEVIAHYEVPGKLIVELVVMDAAGNCGRTGVTVDVIDDIPPNVSAIDDLWIKEDERLDLKGYCVDNDHSQHISYHWMIFGPEISDHYGAEISLYISTPGFYSCHLVATDRGNNSVLEPFNITVSDITSPIADAGYDRAIVKGQALELDASSTIDNDPDFKAGANYTWAISSLGVLVYGEKVSITAMVLGKFHISLIARDPSGNTGVDDMVLTVTTDGVPPLLASSDPGKDWTNVTIKPVILLRFDSALDRTTIVKGVHLVSPSGLDVPISSDIISPIEVRTSPLSELNRGGRYQIVLNGLTDLSGEPIEYTSIPFTVRKEMELLSVDRRDVSGGEVERILVGALPHELTLVFSDKVDPSSSISFAAEGKAPENAVWQLDVTGTIVKVVLGTELPAGIYFVNLSQVVSVHGEHITGPVSFSMEIEITEGVEDDDLQNDGRGNGIVPILIIGPLIILILISVIVCIVIILRKKKATPDDEQGDLPALPQDRSYLGYAQQPRGPSEGVSWEQHTGKMKYQR